MAIADWAREHAGWLRKHLARLYPFGGFEMRTAGGAFLGRNLFHKSLLDDNDFGLSLFDKA